MPSIRYHYLLICLLLLGFALFIALIFISKPAVVVQEFKPQTSYVNAEKVTLTTVSLELKSNASLQAKRSIKLFSQLNGSVLSLSDAFTTGKAFKQGEHLLSIDSTQANLDVQRALLQFKQAELQLQELQAHQQAQSHKNQSSLSALAQGKPQLALAEQQLTTAQAALTLAKQQLQASTLIAPFDGKAVRTTVQVGDLVSIGAPLGMIYSYQQYQARIPISQTWLKFIDLPSHNQPGSSLKAVDAISGQTLQGNITGNEGQLAANGLIYLIADFEALEESKQQSLLLHSPLNIRIISKPLAHIAVIPNHALRSNNRVWLLSAEHTLQFKSVRVLYRDENQAYIDQGLQNGDLVITSSLAAPIEGMALTLAQSHD